MRVCGCVYVCMGVCACACVCTCACDLRCAAAGSSGGGSGATREPIQKQSISHNAITAQGSYYNPPSPVKSSKAPGPQADGTNRSDQICLSLPSPPRLHVWYGYCAHASDAGNFGTDLKEVESKVAHARNVNPGPTSLPPKKPTRDFSRKSRQHISALIYIGAAGQG